MSSVIENTCTEHSRSIPDGWVETTLGEVCEITSAKRIFAKEYKTFGIPFFRGKEVTEKYNGNEVSTELFITREKYEEIKEKYGVPVYNDILLTSVGTLGNPYLVEKDFEFYFKDGNLTWFKNFNKIDSKYLFYWIVSPQGKENLSHARIGSTQQAYTMTALKRVEIVKPPLPEQKAIANILTAFDDKIENLQAQNKTLEQTAQTIFKEWFGKYQVGDELPDGWRVGKLGDVIEIFDSQRIPLSKSQREEKKGEFRYYGATSIMDYVDEYLFDGIYLLLAEDGSVMDDEGYPFLQYVWGKFWVNNHAHILTGKYGFSTEILYLFCKQMKVAGIVTGAVQLKINQKNLLGFELVIPPEQNLAELDKLIQSFFQKVRLNSDQIEYLKKTRDTLLPKLMSGQLRVNEFKA